MTEKVTTMVLKGVDLQCSRCFKKIKKILCKFPQIRDQVFDEKSQIVTVTVVCCSPEKIRDKLCSEGGKVIKSIEIKEPEKKRVAGRPNAVADENPRDPATQPRLPDAVEFPATENQVTGIRRQMAGHGPSYDGFGGGAPWYKGYGIPAQPQALYVGYEYGWQQGGGNFGRGDGDTYSSEQDPSTCSIM